MEGDGSKAGDAFNAFVRTARAQMPTEELADQLSAGLEKRFKQPPVDVIEKALKRSCTQEKVRQGEIACVPIGEGSVLNQAHRNKARQLIFYPDEEDAAVYPLLLQNAPEGAPTDHYQTKAQVNESTSRLRAS